MARKGKINKNRDSTSSLRMPLLIRGARQVAKTYAWG